MNKIYCRGPVFCRGRLKVIGRPTDAILDLRVPTKQIKLRLLIRFYNTLCRSFPTFLLTDTSFAATKCNTHAKELENLSEEELATSRISRKKLFPYQC